MLMFLTKKGLLQNFTELTILHVSIILVLEGGFIN